MSTVLGKFIVVPIREIWSREPEFSAWLAQPENLNELASLIGVDMAAEETEAAVGDFAADIVAKEEGPDGRIIIIENQYGRTDHDHLGKIITYAAGRGGQILVWITEEDRDEHRAAIHWLNDHLSDVDAFLVKIKVVKIGDSIPAPVFEILEQPNNWKKNEMKVSQQTEISEHVRKKMKFLSDFQEYAYDVHPSFDLSFRRKKISSSNATDGCLFLLTKNGIKVGVVLQPNKMIRAEIYIPDDKDLYFQLEARKQEVESAAGFPLFWDEQKDRKACRIFVMREFDIDDAASWESAFAWLCAKAIALKQTCEKLDIM